jgi:hypothetical protein
MDKNLDQFRTTEEKVESKILLYKHLFVFVAFSLFLCLINLISSERISWALWPILGLGMFIAGHVFYVVFHTQRLKECMIKKEVIKESK